MSTDKNLLTLANKIYSIFYQDKEIKSIEELFSDKIYLDIIGNLLPNIQEEISPGKTDEEKIETLSLLLSLLSKLIDSEIDIDPEKIILEHDKKNAQNFLEILLEITMKYRHLWRRLPISNSPSQATQLRGLLSPRSPPR